MTPKFILLIPIIAFATYSCVGTQFDLKPSSAAESASRLFSDAENFFQSKAYGNALKAYHKFYDSYSSNDKAKIALSRIATIYSKQKKYNLSIMTYRKIITEYPLSELALDSMF